MNITIHSDFYSDDVFYNHSSKTDHIPDEFMPHFHDITEMIFIKSGDISYVVGGKKYKLKKDTLVLSRPTDRHCICIDGPDLYERYNILYNEKKLPFNIYEKIPADTNVIDFAENSAVISLFKKMDYYCENLEGENLNKILTNLIEEIFFNIIIAVSNREQNNYEPTNPIICKAVAYIDENLLTLTGIDDICKELYITKSHLHHLFTEHLKITPKKYITTKRLALAQREIYAGGKATEICLKCGFSDYSAFFRAYKKHFNRCPSDIANVSYTTTAKDDILSYYD